MRQLGYLMGLWVRFVFKTIIKAIDTTGVVVWRIRFAFGDYGKAATVGSFAAVSTGWGLFWYTLFSVTTGSFKLGPAMFLGTLITAPGMYRMRPAGQQKRQQQAQQGHNQETQHGQESQQDHDKRQAQTQQDGVQYLSEVPDIDFSDVAGMENLKAELVERVIDPLANPAKYDKYGLSVENGFLLYGPPGTGKTYISKALAGEMRINYIEAKGADLISRWVGAGPENVAQMFREARASEPCLVFIDEIDALAPERGSANQHHSQQQMVNQFLEELSDLNESDANVVVIGATNKPAEIDDAMLRSGRLSQKIEVPPPGHEDRIEILQLQIDAPIAAQQIRWDEIGEMTDGFTAADLAQVANEAARNAMHRTDDVRHQDLEAGINAVNTHTVAR